MKKLIKKINAGKHLSLDESIAAAKELTNENVSVAQASALLMGLSMRPYSVNEIVGFARYAREHTTKFGDSIRKNVVDIVGTGADGASTFNISTASAFVVAGGGVPVAKYGNKAVSSNSGSSDVLEELGINIYHNVEKLKECLEKNNLVFMNAQHFNPMFKTISPVRKNIGIPTIFNVIGPLTNPAYPVGIAMGIYNPRLTEVVAQSARELGYKKGLFFNGSGLDEISVSKRTKVTELDGETITTYMLDDAVTGVGYGKQIYLGAKSKKESAAIILDVLSGKSDSLIGQTQRNVVLLNAAAGFYVSEKKQSFRSCVELAKGSIDSGKALQKLNNLKGYLV